MSVPVNRSSRRKSKYQEQFDESVSILFDEIELAVKWERPSILVAVCATEFVRVNAQTDLEFQLAQVGQQVRYLNVSENQYDIPTLLSQIAERDKTVFFVAGLKWGGGENGNNAYRALNLQRETFIDYQIRMVLWLTESESNDLPRLAPDFWVFRHRVIEFKQPRMVKRNISFSGGESWDAWMERLPIENLNDKIALRERLLAALPEEDESQASRIDLLYTLASLYLSKGDFEGAIALLEQGLEIVRELKDKDLEVQFWFGLGVAFHRQGDHQKAIEAYQKGIDLDPNNGMLWRNLSVVFRELSRARDAIRACKKALRVDPQDAGSWNNLGNVYRDVGRFEEALDAYQKAAEHDPKDANPWINLGTLYLALERLPDAVQAYQRALERRPNDGSLSIDLAVCYRRAQNPEKANEYLELALSMAKGEDEYFWARLEVLQGNIEQALKHLEIALQRGQISAAKIRQDHIFDPIRDDLRLLVLTGQA